MIIKTFAKSEIYNLIFLLITILLLRFPEFFYPNHIQYYTFNNTFRDNLFFTISSALGRELNVILSSILLLIQAIFLGYIIRQYKLINKASYIPEFLFIVIGCSLKSFSYLSPALICNFLFLTGINVIFSTIKYDKQLKKLFYLGVISALGTIIYIPYIFMIPAFIFSLYIIKIVYVKEPVAILLGLCVPYILLYTIYLYFDKTELFKNIWLDFNFSLPQKYSFTNSDFYTIITVLAPICIISLFQISIVAKRTYTYTKNLFASLIIFSIAICLSFVFIDFNNTTTLILLTVPLSILCSIFFVNKSNYYWIKEIIILYTLTSIIFLKITYLF